MESFNSTDLRNLSNDLSGTKINTGGQQKSAKKTSKPSVFLDALESLFELVPVLGTAVYNKQSEQHPATGTKVNMSDEELLSNIDAVKQELSSAGDNRSDLEDELSTFYDMANERGLSVDNTSNSVVTTDNGVVATDNSVDTTIQSEPSSSDISSKPKYTSDEVQAARDVIGMKYGSGNDRYRLLMQRGYDANRIQDLVNQIAENGEYSVLGTSAQQPSTDGTYTVKSGDSWWKIANDYGLTVDSLRKMNNYSGGPLIAGTVLKVR